jgi:hypothetical protein
LGLDGRRGVVIEVDAVHQDAFRILPCAKADSRKFLNARRVSNREGRLWAALSPGIHFCTLPPGCFWYESERKGVAEKGSRKLLRIKGREEGAGTAI